MEDENDAYFTDRAKPEPFGLVHEMNAVSLDMEDDHYGINLEGKKRQENWICTTL
jgi:hypothetical protein